MRVLAIDEGFFDGSRVRRGTVFDMPESAMKRGADGKPLLPQWVLPDTPEGREYIASLKPAAEAAQLEGVIASAGKGAVVKILGER